MMKKIMLFCLLLTLVFSWTLPAHADLSQEEIYVALQEQLHDRLYGVENVLSFESLAQQFTQLGSYKKSAQYRYYTSILADTEAGYYGSLSRNFRLLRLDAAFCEQLAEEGLPTVDELEAYTQGRQAEATGDWASAVACYERSIAVLDSLVRLDAMLYEHANLVQEGLVVGDYKIDTYDNGTCVIKTYTGTTADLTIPRVIGGYQVRGIGDYAFRKNEYLTSVVIPEGVTDVGAAAFDRCSRLTSVAIPEGVTDMECSPFPRCPALEIIEVSSANSVFECVNGVLFNKIEKTLLCYPARLQAESYTVPQGTVTIGQWAFDSCVSLQEIILPDTVTTFMNYAFARCSALASFNIPDNVTTIFANPFISCETLTTISVSPSHPVLETIDGVLFSKLEKSLISYPCGLSCENYCVPHGTLSLGDNCIYYAGLTSVFLPDSVTRIGSEVFCACPNLVSITVESPNTFINMPIDSPNLVFRVRDGSRTAEYMEERDMPYITY